MNRNSPVSGYFHVNMLGGSTWVCPESFSGEIRLTSVISDGFSPLVWQNPRRAKTQVQVFFGWNRFQTREDSEYIMSAVGLVDASGRRECMVACWEGLLAITTSRLKAG